MCSPLLQSTARAFLDFWQTEDTTNSTAQANLMPAFESAASPRDAHMSAPATPLIEWADSAEPQTTVPENLVPGFEEIAIGRMLTGAAPAVAVTAADIYRLTSGTIDFEKEFPLLFAKKKNRCSTSSAFVTFCKTNDNMSFPAVSNGPTGCALRTMLTTLTGQLRQEYNPPLLAIILFLMESLSQSSSADELHALFQKSMSLQNEEQIALFETDCAAGIFDTKGIRYDLPVSQPGFNRFTVGEDKLIWWSRFATAAINKLCFENIRQLERAFKDALDRWNRFKIVSLKIARTADIEEQKLFVDVMNTAAACGETYPAEIQRVADHLLATLFPAAQTYLNRIIVKKKMARVAVTRSFFFEELAEFVDREDHSMAMSTPSCVDSTLCCCECFDAFIFSVDEKTKYAAKKPLPWSDPTRCKKCLDARFQQRKTAAAPSAPKETLTLTALPVTKNTADTSITCRDCTKVFTLSPEKVLWFESQTNVDGSPWVLPKSCSDCRSGREKHCMMIIGEQFQDFDNNEGDYDDRDDGKDEPRDGILFEDGTMLLTEFV